MRIKIEIDTEKGTQLIKSDGVQELQQEAIEEPIQDMELTQEEAERYEVASDIANCCEYLKDSELISLKLIIQKCMARKERAEA